MRHRQHRRAARDGPASVGHHAVVAARVARRDRADRVRAARRAVDVAATLAPLVAGTRARCGHVEDGRLTHTPHLALRLARDRRTGARAERPDLHVVDVPARVYEGAAGDLVAPANPHGGLVARNPGDVVGLLRPRGILDHGRPVLPDRRPVRPVPRDLDGRIGIRLVVRVQPPPELQGRLRRVLEINRTRRHPPRAADRGRVIPAQIHAKDVRAGVAAVRVGVTVRNAALAGGMPEGPLPLYRPARVRVQVPAIDELRNADVQHHATPRIALVVRRVRKGDRIRIAAGDERVRVGVDRDGHGGGRAPGQAAGRVGKRHPALRVRDLVGDRAGPRVVQRVIRAARRKGAAGVARGAQPG